ncbi:MAG: hypothetical protein DCC43_01985 [Candidatus Brocadia sp.]|nr:Type-1 restriction enzyme EcoKI specificity protein [Anaerolineales bacterium]MCE7910758.1 hypothetical protein [Candidatus Brocadia sp. AMX3]MDG5996264.1 hypothetical protein [Candidatus Brocadia sp.]RIK02880.1 MAG: hypothetical protein DCC43_01985 [Candidatus Brocadia sp.]
MVDRKQIPPSWEVVKHSEIAEINPKLPFKNIDDNTEVSFLPMKLVEEEKNIFYLTEFRKYKDVKKGFTPFTNGDVIFAKITPCMENGKCVVLHDLKNEVGFGSTEFHVSRPREGVIAKYIFYFIIQQQFRRIAESNMTGSVGQKRVPTLFFSEFEIPLPPFPEQRRIVSKIEELFSELDKGVESLKTAQQQLKIYRQAVLKWAFEGRLTHENVKDGKLPEGWKWVKLGEVLDFVGSGVTPKGGQEVYQKSGVIFIRSQNVYPNKLKLDDVAFISDEIDERMKRTRVKVNDVLLNITGASIGRCAYVPENFPRGNVNQHVCILRALQEKSFSKFLSSWLNSPNAQHEVMKTQGGATRQGLNYQQIRNLECVLPPILEQHQIVSEIEARLSVCDKLEETITTALRQGDALRQSILKKAFEGRLVEQDPNDEPASKLLERIKAEKAAEQRNVYRKKRPTAPK